MMNKVMAADDAANEKAFTGESGTASGMPSDGGESHEIQDVQVDAEPSLKAGDEVYCSQSVKEEALPGIAVDDDDDDEAGNISKLEEADSPKAEPVLLRMHDIDFAKEVQGTILSETHVLNCAEDFQGPILPEVHDINSANEVKGSVPPEMLDLNFASKVEDPILPEMHDINSSDKVESLIPPELHGMNSVNEVEGSFLPVTHDVNSVDEVDGPILPEMHDVNSADGYVGMSDTDIEVEINEVLSSNDGNILSKNSPFDHEDDRASCFDGEKLFLSCPESAGDIENGSDVDHAEFGDEDAAEVLENWAVQDDVFIDSETIIDSVPLTDTLPTSVKEGIRKPSVNIEKDNSDIYLTSETKCESEDAVKDESVRIEFSESNLPCADTIEAHAGFTKTCSSENLKFTEDAPNSKKNNSSKMEGDVSTSENFLPGMEYCRTDASVTAAEISEVKLDNSQEFLSEGSDLQMNSDCSLDGTTETKIQLALHNLDHPSSRDIHNSEKIASRVQYSTNVSKKRIDLGHQLVREIVKIQHDREQYERQCQVSKQESQNRWKLEKVRSFSLYQITVLIR
ncbi:hypothetical protein O6H91_20G075600 [Diphasiastrum complanatum]|uniref:Uncharacterized protein n=1 Tax=Diphasiastrum complanatum TaxID=34168 RepID=A0ACC2ARW8_DIPCM|nr:hypothetical protein O6H91_20G075600 [Diphasiastrum complanatum]